MIDTNIDFFDWSRLSKGNSQLRKNASIVAGNLLLTAMDYPALNLQNVPGMDMQNFFNYKKHYINNQGLGTTELAGCKTEKSVQMQNFNLSEAYNPPLDRLIRTFTNQKAVEYASGLIYDITPAPTTEWVIHKETVPNYLFPEIPEGGRVKLRSGEAGRYYAALKWYGDGAAQNLRAARDGAFMDFSKQLKALANGAMRKKERLGLAIIEATPISEDVDWQLPFNPTLANDDPTYLTSRDVQTLVNACNRIADDLEDTEVYESNKNNFIILYPRKLWQRMQMMASLSIQPYAESAKYWPGMINFTWVLSNNLSSDTEYYVIVPGGELIGQELVPYINYEEFDPYTLMKGIPAWMSIGFNNGNIKQIKRCKTS